MTRKPKLSRLHPLVTIFRVHDPGVKTAAILCASLRYDLIDGVERGKTDAENNVLIVRYLCNLIILTSY